MKKSVKAAILNIADFGDTDIFPYSFERHIFRDKPDALQKALEELHNNFPAHLAEYEPDNVNTLAAVGYTGFRWATLHEFTVDSLANRVARKSAPEVFHQIADFLSNFENLHPTA